MKEIKACAWYVYKIGWMTSQWIKREIFKRAMDMNTCFVHVQLKKPGGIFPVKNIWDYKVLLLNENVKKEKFILFVSHHNNCEIW